MNWLKLALMSAAVTVLSATTAAAAQNMLHFDLKPFDKQPNWVKLCEKTETQQTCFITRDYSTTDNKPVLAFALFEIRAQPSRYQIRVLLPLGLLMDKGIRFSIAGNTPVEGKFVTCLSTGCFAEIPVSYFDLIALKKGGLVTLAALNQYNQETTFKFPISDISEALAGPAVSEQELQALQENMTDLLKQKAVRPN